MKLLYIALVAATGFLMVGCDDKPSASQPTSTSLRSSPGGGWTEEEMRNAKPRDITVGPGVATLVIGGVVLAAAATAAVLLVRRQR